VRVFFYGLFMDERLLAKKGIEPSEVSLGFVGGYALRIGERATLVHRPDSHAYGAMMDVAPIEVTELYAEDSVADYLPETVIVELMDGTQVEAICYILPGDKVTGTNKEYAESLLEVATRLDFPDSYLDQIRQAFITPAPGPRGGLPGPPGRPRNETGRRRQ
jgi:hypothetical protein